MNRPASQSSTSTSSGAGAPEPPSTLLSARSALILTVALLIAVGSDVLTVLAGRSPADGCLAAGAAFGGAIPLLDKIIGA